MCANLDSHRNSQVQEPARLPGALPVRLNPPQGTGQKGRAASTAWGSSDPNTMSCEPTDYSQEVTGTRSRTVKGKKLHLRGMRNRRVTDGGPGACTRFSHLDIAWPCSPSASQQAAVWRRTGNSSLLSIRFKGKPQELIKDGEHLPYHLPNM